MGVWASLRFELDFQDTFLTPRGCARTWLRWGCLLHRTCCAHQRKGLDACGRRES